MLIKQLYRQDSSRAATLSLIANCGHFIAEK